MGSILNHTLSPVGARLSISIQAGFSIQGLPLLKRTCGAVSTAPRVTNDDDEPAAKRGGGGGIMRRASLMDSGGGLPAGLGPAPRCRAASTLASGLRFCACVPQG